MRLPAISSSWMLYFLLIISGVFILSNCTKDSEVKNPYEGVTEGINSLPSSNQRAGDVESGKSYLLYGDYVESGIPSELFGSTLGALLPRNNELQRVGENAEIPFQYTQVKHPNGIDIVSPNCFQCHAGYVGDQFILGLGNSYADFTADQSQASPLLDFLVQSEYGANSKEWEAYAPFTRAVKATGPNLVTKTIGDNPADKLALILAAHRDPEDLTWQDEPTFTIPDETYPVDVPAWWLLKKKHVMFSTGIGRGDFARLMMASSLLTLQDSARAREIDQKFVDVATYIKSLEPPIYPGQIDRPLAEKGKVIFKEICAKCHGDYENGTYPNLIIDHDLIATDAYLAQSYEENPAFISWYNNSWFSKGEYEAKLQPGNGYVAPPLDGIWATAPYLHNGSIPNLAALINSKIRPDIWERTATPQYDYNNVGLKYETVQVKEDILTYDTSLDGYGNQGHYFGDHLTDPERTALLEYLKTL